jgi:hypothetical protein
MSQTTSVDSLFARQEKGKFLNEEELKQIQQDLSYLISENKSLTLKIEYYQTHQGQTSSNHDQMIVHEKKIMEQEKQALDQEKQALDQQRQALEKHRQTIEQQRQFTEQQKQQIEKDKEEINKQKRQIEEYSSSPQSIHDHHDHLHRESFMPIDVQLIYFMLFIILLILILKK